MPLMDRERTACRAEIRIMVQSVSHRPSPHEIEQRLTGRYPKKTIRTCLKSLIEDGSLAYSLRYGRQVVEPSMNRSVRISPRISLAPEGRLPGSGGITVFLRHGSSFGTGRHPTTRLALKCLDDLVFSHTDGAARRIERVLDIGTGSGVLAIAALKLGALSATGLDIDSCALFEAGENAMINGVAGRMRIDNLPLENLAAPYHLILANLRAPTLYVIVQDLKRLCVSGGFLVLSGIHSDELDPLVTCYTDLSFELLEARHADGWAAVSLQCLPK